MTETQSQRLPFGAQWQRMFTCLAIDDDRFGEVLADHVKSDYLDNEVSQWIWATAEEHRRRYGVTPSWTALEEAARKLDPKIRPLYVLGLEQIRQSPRQDEEWVRTTAVEWVRRNVFARAFHDSRALYNAGKVDAAYDTLMREMDRFQEVTLDAAGVDETWLFEDLPARQARRWERQNHHTATPTGIHELDLLLDGGVDLGQLAIWMAYSKVGKTTWLINLGRVAVRACQRYVAHFFFEGTRDQITNRYDASFSAELYNAVKRGEFGSERYSVLWKEYQHYRRRLYVRGFTRSGAWEHTVTDIWEALERLRRREGWEPQVVLVDYADLLKGRGSYGNEWDSNAAAYRDLKTLSTKRQGYAIHTGAQAKKPKDDAYDTKPHVLKSNDLGGRYEKVKVADLLASLNATLDERTRLNQIRVWVEAVRDHPAAREIVVPCDFPRMMFGAGVEVPIFSDPAFGTPPGPDSRPTLGYRQVAPPFGGAP